MGILAMFRNERWNNYATSHFDRISDWHFWFPRAVVVKVMMIASLEHTLQTVFGDSFGSRYRSFVGF